MRRICAEKSRVVERKEKKGSTAIWERNSAMAKEGKEIEGLKRGVDLLGLVAKSPLLRFFHSDSRI